MTVRSRRASTMAIPEVPAFESFLSGCSIVKERPNQSWVLFAESRLLDYSTGAVTPELYLRYPEGDLQLDSILKKIQESLALEARPAHRDIAIATLGLIVESRDPHVMAVRHANECLTKTQRAQLSQSVILPSRVAARYEARLGTYTIRAFNPEKILYWAERCGSAYPIDLHKLAGCAAIERDWRDAELIDWQARGCARRMCQTWGKKVVEVCLLDTYYQAVAASHADEIEHEMKADVLVLESGAMIWVDADSFLRMPLTKVVSLFKWQGSSSIAGWALYSDFLQVNVNLPPEGGPDGSVAWLADELGFRRLSQEKEFDQGVKNYCRFLQRAHGHRLNGRRDEAFLHFAIALDLILGSEGKSAESVAQRTAVLVHRQFERSFKDQVRRMKTLYDVRSKYVHAGVPTTPDNLEEIDRVSMQILWVLLAASAAGSIGSIPEWSRRIDFLAAALLADMPLGEAGLEGVGVPPVGRVRCPPHRVDHTGPPSRLMPMSLWEARRRGK